MVVLLPRLTLAAETIPRARSEMTWLPTVNLSYRSGREWRDTH